MFRYNNKLPYTLVTFKSSRKINFLAAYIKITRENYRVNCYNLRRKKGTRIKKVNRGTDVYIPLQRILPVSCLSVTA